MNRQRRLTLPRPTAASAATQLRVRLTLQFLWRQAALKLRRKKQGARTRTQPASRAHGAIQVPTQTAGIYADSVVASEISAIARAPKELVGLAVRRLRHAIELDGTCCCHFTPHHHDCPQASSLHFRFHGKHRADLPTAYCKLYEQERHTFALHGLTLSDVCVRRNFQSGE